MVPNRSAARRAEGPTDCLNATDALKRYTDTRMAFLKPRECFTIFTALESAAGSREF